MRLILLLILSLCAGAAAADELLSRQAFTEEAARMFRIKAPHDEVVVAGELQINFRRQGDADKHYMQMFLDNAYKEYRENPAQLQQVLASHLRATDLTAPSCRAEDVLPTVKDAAYVEQIRQMLGKMPADDAKALKPDGDRLPLAEPLSDDLFLVYVLDTPEATSTLNAESLSKCGIPREQLRQRALDNLRTHVAGFRVEPVEKVPGVSLVEGDHYYETSLLALDEYWSQARFPYKGEIVVATPARGLLLIADGADGTAVDSLSRIAHNISAKAAYALNPALHIRRNGAWVRYRD